MASASALTRQLETVLFPSDSSLAGEPSEARSTAAEQATTSGRTEFVTAVEEQIEQSKRHWTVLAESESNFTDDEDERAVEIDNMEVFKNLQSHPAWGGFFVTFGYDTEVSERIGSLEVGEKFAEGGQAELFHAKVTWANPEENDSNREHGIEWVLKMFKKGTSLRRLQKQWPLGYLQFKGKRYTPEEREKSLRLYHCDIQYGTLLEDGRFAFLMHKEHGDLRSLIDRTMLELGSGHDSGPLPKEKANFIIYVVACGMNWLHDNDIVHRDLKTANILVHEYGGKTYSYGIADFECSVGVVGTGFFRAPEILRACKEKNIHQKQELFTRASDVYNYGMTCYEILTGKLPFEHHPLSDNKSLLTDLVIDGLRPEVPDFVEDWAVELLQRCWQSDPAARPSFGEILSFLEANSNSPIIKKLAAGRADEA